MKQFFSVLFLFVFACSLSFAQNQPSLDKGAYSELNPKPHIINQTNDTPLEEVFGLNQNMFGPAGMRGRGNIYLCITPRKLVEHRLYLNPGAGTNLWFVVYEGSTFNGTYNLVNSVNFPNSGPGEGWYSSGTIDFDLQAGMYYMIYALFDVNANYWNQQNITPYPIDCSFGQLVSGVGWNWSPVYNSPPNPTETPTEVELSGVAYYQTIVTDDIGGGNTARLQVIHNAADVLADPVDVYLDGTLLLNDFAFRAATPFIDAPAGVQLNIGVAPGNSGSVNDTLKNFQVTLAAGETYVAFANGVLNPSLYAANPDGRSTAFTLFVKSQARETGLGSDVDFFVLHGSTDAPTVDIKAGTTTLVDNAAYGDITGYIQVPPADYVLNLYLADGVTLVGSFNAPLAGLGGGAAAVFASGFLDPTQNQNGEGFGIFAALANGTVIEFLPVSSTTFTDDFEAYIVGQQLACQNPIDWTTWSNLPCDPTEDAYISSNYAYSGANSTVIVSANDLVKPLGNQTSGKWYMSFVFYIPAGKSGYFNQLTGFTPDPFEWGCDAYFDVGGGGRLDITGGGGGGTVVPFTWVVGEWNQVVLIVDLDSPTHDAEFWIGTTAPLTQVGSAWDWTNGGIKANRIAADDFFGAAATDEMYFDDYYFGDAMPPIIPVELTSFTGNVNNLGQVILNWETATEINNQGFEIERRTETSEYRTIGFVEGYGTTTEPRSYIYTDVTAENGTNYYRLKQVDFNGTYEYSDEVEIDVTGPLTFDLAQNYPNPFNPSTSIKYSVPESGNIRLSVFNVVGEEVAVLVDGFSQSGIYEVTFDASNLSTGVYLYKLQSANSVQTKKMMLLK